MDKNADIQLLQKAQRTVSQCDRCGACLPVCPLFGVRDIESSSARGKNTLTRALAGGVIEPKADVLAAVDFCLLCRTCVETCPNRVATDEAMVDVRQYLVNRTGAMNAKYRAVGGFLKSRGLVKVAAGALAIARRMGLSRVFPYGMAPEEYTRAQYLAAFAGPAALGKKGPPLHRPVTRHQASTRVAYFHGCGIEDDVSRGSGRYPRNPENHDPAESSGTTSAAGFPTSPTACAAISSHLRKRTSASTRRRTLS